MRSHTLKSTNSEVYSQMGRFLTAAGKSTYSEQAAATDPKTGKPVENAARNIWVTGPALATALNTSFFAESVAKFAIVMGAALLLVARAVAQAPHCASPQCARTVHHANLGAVAWRSACPTPGGR